MKKKKKSKLDGIEFHHKSDKGANFPIKEYPIRLPSRDQFMKDNDNTELYKLWDRQLKREEEYKKSIERTRTITVIAVIIVWVIILSTLSIIL